MHIDLNSCFAIIEQQANRLLRGRSVGVAAYDTPRGFVLAASYEAKAMGVKLGVNVEQSRSMAPGIVIMTPDPAKYREAHKRFKAVLEEFSPDVTPKSIDEFVLDMSSAHWRVDNDLESAEERQAHNQNMLQIGHNIKKRIAESLGEWVTVNIGIAPNRFLAKYAAGFDKPDGMTLIDRTNLIERYSGMKLVDLPGINTRFRARLRAAKIYTPLDFLEADMELLRRRVFKSINGYHWYMRLRGYEADSIDFGRKSIGHQYALSDKTTDLLRLESLLMKLCEKTGRRLRKNNYYASGIHLYLGFVNEFQYDGPASFENMPNIRSWHHGEKLPYRLYSTQDIYEAAKRLLYSAEIPGLVKIMSVHVFGLEPWEPVQLGLFDARYELGEKNQADGKSPIRTLERVIRATEASKRASDAVDAINNRYGEFIVTPAMMMDMQGTILDRIAFGQIRDL